MNIDPGSDIRIRTEDGSLSLHGKVAEVMGEKCLLKLDEAVRGLEGRVLMIVHDSGSQSVKVERVDDDGTILVVPSEEERRAFFRVDDVIPVKIRRAGTSPKGSSRFISPPLTIEGLDLPDEEAQENPLVGLLKEINTKLDFLINTLMMKDEGLNCEERVPVNISATGMRFDFNEEVKVGDIMELKMVLPTYPPVAILTYGEVVRVKETRRDGELIYETAVKFREMTEEVREEIIQYTLKRQREVIKKRWEEI